MEGKEVRTERKEVRTERMEIRAERKEVRTERKEVCPARRPRARGVTLFEVLIVVTIIALISAGIGLHALKMKTIADEEQALTDGRTVLTGVEAYWALHGGSRCPSVDEMMREKLFRRDGRGRDPWGQSWRIECTEGEAVVNSNGPDRKPGTEDDIRIPPV
jgi:general secretion pathway protein G